MKKEPPPVNTIKKCTCLSLWLTLLTATAILTFTFHAVTHMAGATDTFKALAAGRHHLNHGIDTTDPFSENSLKQGPTEEQIKSWSPTARRLAEAFDIETVKKWHPTGWVNQNWLADVILYQLAYKSPIADAQQGSYNSLVYAKFAIYLLTALCIYCSIRLLKVNKFLAAAATCAAMFVSRSFLTIRPADFSNLMTALLLVTLILAAYRNPRYIWLFLPIVFLWSNLHGGYVFAFAALAVFTITSIIVYLLTGRQDSPTAKLILHSILVGLITLIAIIILNPYHLTNITHSFVVALSKDAKQWQITGDWTGALSPSQIGTTVPFLALLAVTAACLLLWTITRLSASSRIAALRRVSKVKSLPVTAVNLALIAVTAATIYIALKHRRFVPMAAIFTAPLIALLINNTLVTISAMRNLTRQGKLEAPPLPRAATAILLCTSTLLLLIFASWVGIKFNNIYLAPWPPGDKQTSVAMRMTGSSSKPFDACRFIRDNQLAGNLFCYWTEAEFVELHQLTDTKTGEIPLKVFIDSRAQTAFSQDTQDTFELIYSAGPFAEIYIRERRRISDSDYTRIGNWIGIRLEKNNVNTVLMSQNEWQNTFTMSLERNPKWRIVFYSPDYKLYADITTEQGKALYDGIFTGQTTFPNESSRQLTTAFNMLTQSQTDEEKQTGLDAAIKTYNLNPSKAALDTIIYAANYPQLKDHVDQTCTDILTTFEQNRQQLRERDGYFNHLAAAMTAIARLGKNAQQQKNFPLAQAYNEKLIQLRNERQILLESKSW